MVKLTPAQVDALAVLASDPAREFEGWKRRSTTEGFPRVNMVAISGLTRAGLARPIWPMRSSPYTHDTRYRIDRKSVV